MRFSHGRIFERGGRGHRVRNLRRWRDNNFSCIHAINAYYEDLVDERVREGCVLVFARVFLKVLR